MSFHVHTFVFEGGADTCFKMQAVNKGNLAGKNILTQVTVTESNSKKCKVDVKSIRTCRDNCNFLHENPRSLQKHDSSVTLNSVQHLRVRRCQQIWQVLNAQIPTLTKTLNNPNMLHNFSIGANVRQEL